MLATRCGIALMEACNNFFYGNGSDSCEGLYYYSEAMGIVKKRLQGDDALNDATITLVVWLILQEEMRGKLSDSDVHYSGLKRMVELRGGLGQLEGNRTLALKICK